VWLVSRGLLDDTARATELPPIPQVARLAARIGARGQVTVGGRLEPDANGFPASAMAKARAGDWRDPAHIRDFAAVVATDLASVERVAP
jgi:menaquinone-dependent protoporphyrinogen oxidase